MNSKWSRVADGGEVGAYYLCVETCNVVKG